MQPADPNMIAISQAVAGTVASKYETGVPAIPNISPKKAIKSRGRPFWASSEERVNCEVALPIDLLWTYPCSV
jgi:hypothetical protein